MESPNKKQKILYANLKSTKDIDCEFNWLWENLVSTILIPDYEHIRKIIKEVLEKSLYIEY